MSACSNNCGNHATCDTETGKCSCEIFYKGEDCSERWRSDNTWWILWNISIAIALLLVVIIFGVCVRFLYSNLDKMKKNGPKSWPISIHIMLLGIITSLLRIVAFAVDPYAEREILPPAAWAVLFNIPIVTAEGIVLMLFLYWFEVAQKKRLDFPKNVQKLRPVLIGLCFFLAAILLPITIIGNALLNEFIISLSNYLSAVILLFTFIILCLAGFQLVGRLRSFRVAAELNEQAAPTEDVITMFIFRVRWYLIVIGISVALLVLTLVLFAVTHSRTKEFPFLGFQIAFRIFEFTYIMPTLFMLVQRKKPSQSNVTPAIDSTMSIKSHS